MPDRRPTVADAKLRAPVTFPGHVPGTTMHGRLIAIGGRRRRKDQAVIILPSGRYVNRPVDQLRLLEVGRAQPTDPTAPRVLP